MPGPDDPITIGDKRYRQVREGLATVLAPYQDKPGIVQKGHNNEQGSQAVFYNPIQQFNRDLSVLAILIYGEGALATRAADRALKTRNRQAKNAKKGSRRVNGGEGASNTKKRRADEIEDDSQPEALKRAKTSDPVDDDEVEIRTEEVTAEPTDTGLEALLQQAPAGQRRPRFTILDALSATGLRALRYAKEIPFATNIIANDMSKDAVQAIELNIDHNEVSDRVHSNVDDARAYMYSKVGNERQQPSEKYVHRFDVVDLDPYGTAAPFIDSSIQALSDGGMLCVTCTDSAVFASKGYFEKTYALYGGLPVDGPHCHEAGLRLIINSVATTGAKYGIAIEPLLSLSIDFYVRIFIRVHKRPNEVKLLAGTTMLTYTCDQGCGAWVTQPLARNIPKANKNGEQIWKHSIAQGPTVPPNCEHCGFKMHLGGPMWAGPLHNPYFIQRMLDRIPTLDSKVYGTLDRLKGMLTVALEEDLTLATSNHSPNTSAPLDPPTTIPTTNSTDLGSSTTPAPTSPAIIPRLPPSTIDTAPFFLIPNYLSKVLHTQTPSEDSLRGALRHLGYRVTRSHCKRGSMKTDAPWEVIWEVMREWVRLKKPVKEGAVKPGMPGWGIMRRKRGGEEGWVWKVVGEVRRGLEGLVGREGRGGREELGSLLRGALWRVENEAVGKEKGMEEVGEDENGAVVRESGEMRKQEVPLHQLKVVFDEELGKEKPRGKLVRYQINPRENWGPMNRAGGS
jgi:tRNA (guanine26-N2/guanine27-N2)-dimethyltransferase